MRSARSDTHDSEGGRRTELPTLPSLSGSVLVESSDDVVEAGDDDFWTREHQYSFWRRALGPIVDEPARLQSQGILAIVGFALAIVGIMVLTPEDVRLEAASGAVGQELVTEASTTTELGRESLRSEADMAAAGARSSSTDTTTRDPLRSVGGVVSEPIPTGSSTTSTTTKVASNTPEQTTTSTSDPSSTSSSTDPSSTTDTTTDSSTTSSGSSTSSTETTSPSSSTSSSDPSTTTTTEPTSSSGVSHQTSIVASESTDPPCSIDWELAARDTFDGTGLDSSVWAPIGGSTPAAADGLVTVTDSGGLEQVEGQTHGRYEMRVRVGGTAGIAVGEIVLRPTGGGETSVVVRLDAGEWRTVVMEWSPSQLVVSVDGAVTSSISAGEGATVPSGDHVLGMQLVVDAAASTESASMDIDTIEVYRYTGTC